MQDTSAPSNFKFFCPHCAQSLEATKELIGRNLECPVCKNPFVVPSPAGQAPPSLPEQTNAAPPSTKQQPPLIQHAAANQKPKKLGYLAIGLIVVASLFFGVVGLSVLGAMAGSRASTQSQKKKTEQLEREVKKQEESGTSSFAKLRDAAEKGDAAAQNRLAFRYSSGHGVPEDFAEAIYWWRKAAEQGHAGAQFALGFSYKNGADGLPLDKAEAARWWQKAAEQGHAAAQFHLGLLYRDGSGVPKDMMEAIKWWQKAAEQGYDGAQFQLGLCYENGNGVPKDVVEAYKWIYLANLDESGKIPSLSLYGGNLKILSQRLTVAQTSLAKQRCEEWLATHPRKGFWKPEAMD